MPNLTTIIYPCSSDYDCPAQFMVCYALNGSYVPNLEAARDAGHDVCGCSSYLGFTGPTCSDYSHSTEIQLAMSIVLTVLNFLGCIAGLERLYAMASTKSIRAITRTFRGVSILFAICTCFLIGVTTSLHLGDIVAPCAVPSTTRPGSKAFGCTGPNAKEYLGDLGLITGCFAASCVMLEWRGLIHKVLFLDKRNGARNPKTLIAMVGAMCITSIGYVVMIADHGYIMYFVCIFLWSAGSCTLFVKYYFAVQRLLLATRRSSLDERARRVLRSEMIRLSVQSGLVIVGFLVSWVGGIGLALYLFVVPRSIYGTYREGPSDKMNSATWGFLLLWCGATMIGLVIANSGILMKCWARCLDRSMSLTRGQAVSAAQLQQRPAARQHLLPLAPAAQPVEQLAAATATNNQATSDELHGNNMTSHIIVDAGGAEPPSALVVVDIRRPDVDGGGM